MKKPTFALNFRISVDSSQNQRFTKDEVITELRNSGVNIERGLIIRKRDGDVMGEVLDTPTLFDQVIHDIKRVNKLDTKSIPEKVLKFNEEFGEFSTELIKLLGITYKPYDEEHFIEESADALQVQLSIQLAACELKGIDFNRVLEALLIKNKKWEAMSPKYTRNEKPDICVAVIGLTHGEARALALKNGHILRITRSDKNDYIITCDFRTDRVSVEMDNGVVTKAIIS